MTAEKRLKRSAGKAQPSAQESGRDGIFIDNVLSKKFPELRRCGILRLVSPLKHVAPTELVVQI